MAKVFLHKPGKESKVFDTEEEEYETALKNGWSKDRTVEPKDQPLEEVEDQEVFDITLATDEELIGEAKARGIWPEVAAATEIKTEDTKQIPPGEVGIDANNDGKADTEVKLSDLKKPQLQEIATNLGIEFASKTTVAELIDLIMGAQDEE